MRPPRAGQLIKSVVIASAVLIGLATGSPAAARGGYHRPQATSALPCGVAAGGLPEPAETQRCLAERYKAGKARRGAPATGPSNSTAPIR